VAAVKYAFTHKQYIEQHNETQYIERNIYKKECINITIRINNTQNETEAYKIYNHLHSDTK